jgi:hypothetical protein
MKLTVTIQAMALIATIDVMKLIVSIVMISLSWKDSVVVHMHAKDVSSDMYQ